MVQIVALNNVPQGYNYGQEVRFEVHDQHKMDYREAADFLNLSQTEVICLQHEFGIFGGDDGAYILSMLGNLKKPVVTTLHTVIKEPTKGQLETLRSVCLYSTLKAVGMPLAFKYSQICTVLIFSSAHSLNMSLITSACFSSISNLPWSLIR